MMPDPSEQTTGRPHREEAPNLDDLRARVLVILSAAMTKALPTGYAVRRITDEVIAPLLDSLNEDRRAFADIRQAIAPEGVCDCEGPCDVYRVYTIASDRLAGQGGGP